MQIINHYENENGLQKDFIEANVEIIQRPNTKSHNNVQEVYINGVRGFLKMSVNEHGEPLPILDKFEYLVAKLSTLFGIKSAEEYLLEDNNQLYLFSKSVVSQTEQLVMTSKLNVELLKRWGIPNEMIHKIMTEKDLDYKKLIEEFNLSPEIAQKFEELVTEVSTINNAKILFRQELEPISKTPGSERYILPDNSENQIEYVINMFINKIKLLELPNQEEIIRDYIRMCFFDALIGNKDRNTNNYGLVKKEDGTYSFAPLFDSSTVTMPNIEHNLWQLNEYLMSREATINYIINKYPQYVQDLLQANVTDSITKIALDTLDENEFNLFNGLIIKNLNLETINNNKKH